MCMFSSPPSMPAAPPPPPPPPPAPQAQDPSVKQSRQKTKQQAALSTGRDETILTSGLGLVGDAPSSAKKKLLGN